MKKQWCRSAIQTGERFIVQVDVQSQMPSSSVTGAINMLFDVKELRKGIEHEYIGFSPNTTNVKPVHLANGMFRGLLNEANDTTSGLFRFVFSSSKKDGTIPKGHELDRVYQWLLGEGRI